jgi:hypothetical protein
MPTTEAAAINGDLRAFLKGAATPAGPDRFDWDHLIQLSSNLPQKRFYGQGE